MNTSPTTAATAGSRHATRLLSLTAGAMLLAPLGAQAANSTWLSTGSNEWTTPTNWSDGAIADGADNTAFFDALDIPTGTTTVSLGTSSRTIGSLVFGDTNTSTTGSWALTNGGNSSYTLTLAGTAPTVTVNSSTATISAVVTGTNGLTKAGAGILLLSGTNTYTGGTFLNAGTLRLANASAAGGAAGGTITVSSGTLAFSSGFTLANAITMTGGSLSTVSSGLTTLSGAVDIQGNASITPNGSGITISGPLSVVTTKTLTFNPGNPIILSGTISGGGTIDKSANINTLTISADNSGFSGTIKVARGELIVGNNNALGTGTLWFSASNDQPSTIRSSSTDARTIATSLLLSGGNPPSSKWVFGTAATGSLTFTGNVTLGSLGAVMANNTVELAGVIGGGNGVSYYGGTGELILSGSNTYTGVTNILAGTLSVRSLGNGGAASTLGNVSNSGTNLLLNGGTLKYLGATGTSDRRFSIGFGAGANGANGSGSTLDASGSGAIVFSNTAALNAGITVTQSPPSWTAGTSTITVPDGSRYAVGMSFNASGIPANTYITAVNGNVITLSATTTAARSYQSVTATGGPAKLTLTGSNTDDNTLASLITDPTAANGAQAAATITTVVKSGSGKWVLTNANSYTGGTILNAGTLKAGNAGAFGTGAITLNGGVLDLTDYNVGNPLNITGTTASVRLPTSAGELTSNFAAGSNFRGWQRQSGVAGGNNTVAQLLGGTAGSAATVTSSWSASTDTSTIVSDVLDIKGINGTTFVLQMSYADSGNGSTWENSNVYLGWLNGSSQWVNSVLGNNNGTGTLGTQYFGAYDPSGSYNLGDYGVDAENNTVWAVVNHNSEFAVVVPEPAMLALLGLGGLALLRRRKNG